MDVPQQYLLTIFNPVAVDNINGEAGVDEVKEEVVVGKCTRKFSVTVVSLHFAEL